MRNKILTTCCVGVSIMYMITALSQGANPLVWTPEVILTFICIYFVLVIGVSGFYFVNEHNNDPEPIEGLDEIENKYINRFGICPRIEKDIPLHSYHEMIEFGRMCQNSDEVKKMVKESIETN